MHLLGRYTGVVDQEALWKLLLRGDLLLEHPTQPDLQRMAALMAKYADRPMDFADASLVAIAERLRLERIVTLDRADFAIYQLYGRKPFVIVGP
jgi:predicted nucleic acid-binding protein